MSGLLVNAIDGPAGTITALLCTKRGELTHIVVREARPWGTEEIPVPVEQIAHVEAGHIQLRLDKRGLSFLPAVLATRDRRASKQPHTREDEKWTGQESIFRFW